MERIISCIKNQTQDRHIYVHCWRGGMRSGVVAWMLDLFGYKVSVLEKGYKAFRASVLQSFSAKKNILILGGKTGSAKTLVLYELQSQGEQVIDLEAHANHKGSAFGGINEPHPPSQEQFENDLFMKFRKFDPEKYTWLEDESQRIGTINLPNQLWIQMKTSSVIYLDIPFEERLNYIVETYGSFSIGDLVQATLRIQKRLGGMETKKTIQFLQEGNLHEAFSILLKYYDKFYNRATELRNPQLIKKIKSEHISPAILSSLVKQALST